MPSDHRFPPSSGPAALSEGSTMEPSPVSADQDGTEVIGVTFAEQLRENLKLSSDPRERAVVEIAAEVDHLDDIRRTNKSVGANTKVNISTQRIRGLRHLQDSLAQLEETRSSATKVALMAGFIRQARTVLLEDLNLPPEQVEVFLQALLGRIEEAETASQKA